MELNNDIESSFNTSFALTSAWCFDGGEIYKRFGTNELICDAGCPEPLARSIEAL